MKSRRCPICSNKVKADGEFHPFCSRRCQLADLGHWFNEDYTVDAGPAEPKPPVNPLSEAQGEIPEE